MAAVALSLVVLIPTMVAVGLIYRESRARSADNRELIQHVNQQSRMQRDALVAFVCTAVAIQREGETPVALEYERRFGAILLGLDARCPP